MTRIVTQYPKLTGGVTQRPLREQRTSQLLEMLNMHYDPVVGLTRRPGAELVSSTVINFPVDGPSDYRTHEYEDNGHISVTYPVSALAGGPNPHRVTFVNHDTGTVSEPTVPVSDDLWDAAMESGFGAITNVGDLVVATENGQIPSYTTSYTWATPSNQRHHVM